MTLYIKHNILGRSYLNFATFIKAAQSKQIYKVARKIKQWKLSISDLV